MDMPPVPEPAVPDPAGVPVESSRRDAPALRGSARKGPRRLPRRAAAGRRSFTATLRALDELAASGAKVSVRIDDLDGGSTVLEGDDFVTLPVAGLGVVPLLIEIAAAIEAAFLGLPSIALSLLMDKQIPDYDHAAGICLKTIQDLLRIGIAPGQVMSVNVPALRSPQMPKGTKVVRQCTRPWDDVYEKRETPVGKPYFWNTAKFTLKDTEDDTDVAALKAGYVTVTPLKFDLTCYGTLNELEAEFGE